MSSGVPFPFDGGVLRANVPAPLRRQNLPEIETDANLVFPHRTPRPTPFDHPRVGDGRLRMARHVDEAAALKRESV